MTLREYFNDGGYVIAIDVGENDKLVLWDGSEFLDKPTAPRGSTQAQKTAFAIEWALQRGHIVLESPGIGASGLEPETIRDIVDAAPFDIYKISARAVKNRVKTLKAQGLIDNDATQTDEDCARLIYELATKLPIGEELSPWRYVPTREKYTRIYTSVRPYDKRNYKDPQVDKWMSRLIAFDKLPEFDQLILSNGKKRTPDYAVARVLPFAMAFDEEFTESRNGYEFILGLYSDGYPSFYRRCTVSLMQRVAKELYERANGVKTGSGKNGNILNSDITPQIRKEAWKEARKIIRHLYSLSK